MRMRSEGSGFEAVNGAVKHGKQHQDVKKMITWPIEVGKASEMVALDQRRFEVAAREIKSVLPEAVIMDGAIVSGSLEAYLTQ